MLSKTIVTDRIFIFCKCTTCFWNNIFFSVLFSLIRKCANSATTMFFICSMKPEEILVIVGTHKLGSGLGVRIMAEELLLHENYIRENLHDINDIGLIRLKEKINFTEHVSPICLPVSGTNNICSCSHLIWNLAYRMILHNICKLFLTQMLGI